MNRNGARPVVSVSAAAPAVAAEEAEAAIMNRGRRGVRVAPSAEMIHAVRGNSFRPCALPADKKRKSPSCPKETDRSIAGRVTWPRGDARHRME